MYSPKNQRDNLNYANLEAIRGVIVVIKTMEKKQMINKSLVDESSFAVIVLNHLRINNESAYNDSLKYRWINTDKTGALT